MSFLVFFRFAGAQRLGPQGWGPGPIGTLGVITKPLRVDSHHEWIAITSGSHSEWIATFLTFGGAFDLFFRRFEFLHPLSRPLRRLRSHLDLLCWPFTGVATSLKPLSRPFRGLRPHSRPLSRPFRGFWKCCAGCGGDAGVTLGPWRGRWGGVNSLKPSSKTPNAFGRVLMPLKRMSLLSLPSLRRMTINLSLTKLF